MTLTLSQVRDWDTQHLMRAAHHWAGAASRWEDAFAEVSQLIHAPGGTPWEGAAAHAAQERALADRLHVNKLADRLRTASTVARDGAEELQAAKQRVLAVVSAAQAGGFSVGEDFSLTTYRLDAQSAAAAEEQAREFGRQLRGRIEELIGLDQQLAERITTAAGDVDKIGFSDAEHEARYGHATVHALDSRILKEAPPQPSPPDPKPGSQPPVTDAEDVRRVLDPLQNGGRRGTNDVGTQPRVKEVWDEASMKRLWDYLTRNAEDSAPPPDYNGPVRLLPDGTRIGLRSSGDWGDTIDVWYPNDGDVKAHLPYQPYFPSTVVGPPQLPAPSGMPVSPIPLPHTTHPATAVPPAGIFEPNGLPPWLQNPSAPGLYSAAQPPSIMPGVAVPDTPQPSSTAADDFSGLPEISDAITDAGKAVGSVVVGGVVVLGALLATAATPSGQIAR